MNLDKTDEKILKNLMVDARLSASQRALKLGMSEVIVLSRIKKLEKEKKIKGFTEKYNVSLLVYYEIYGSPGAAIYREKCVKKWNRDWKLKYMAGTLLS